MSKNIQQILPSYVENNILHLGLVHLPESVPVRFVILKLVQFNLPVVLLGVFEEVLQSNNSLIVLVDNGERFPGP